MSCAMAQLCPFVDEPTEDGSEDDAVQLPELLSLSMWRRLVLSLADAKLGGGLEAISCGGAEKGAA